MDRRLVAIMLAMGTTLPVLGGAEIPRPAPEFVIRLTDGQQLSLTSLRGKVVALEFLLTNCPRCKTCSSILDKLEREYGPKGFQPVGVAMNAMAAMFVPDYVKELQLNFPVGVSQREPVLRFLQHSPIERMFMPQLVIIDRRGTIRAQHAGDSPFFQDEEKNIRAHLEILLKEPTGKKTVSFPKSHAQVGSGAALGSAPPPLVTGPSSGQTFLQVAAAKGPQAKRIVEDLRKKGLAALTAPVPNGALFRVLVGPLPDSAAVAKAKADLERAGFRSMIRKY